MGLPDGLPRELRKSVAPLTATAKWWEARYAEGDLPDVDEPFAALDIPVIVDADHMFNEEKPEVVIDSVRRVIELSP